MEKRKQIPLGQIIKLAEKVEDWNKHWDYGKDNKNEFCYKGSFKDIDFRIEKTPIFVKGMWYKISVRYDDVLLSKYKVKAKNDLRLKELCQDIKFVIKQQEQEKREKAFNYMKRFVKNDEIKIDDEKIKISLDAMLRLAEKVENWQRGYLGYKGSIKRSKIKIDVSKYPPNPFMPRYCIDIYKENTCVYPNFNPKVKKSKIKKLYKDIKSKVEQQERDEIKNKRKKGFNKLEDLINKKG